MGQRAGKDNGKTGTEPKVVRKKVAEGEMFVTSFMERCYKAFRLKSVSQITKAEFWHIYNK